MVFSAVPVYLDPPNWQQQDQQIGVSGDETPLLLPTTATSSSSIRPERALITAVQPPEPALNCPRCESANTKFCYYNNYSKSQPRHFCKTCRRYWTRGGALRNVPVGGGCRRNKRSKNNTRSPPAATSGSAIAITNASNSGSAVEALGLDQHQIPPPPPLLPFISTLHQFTNFSSADVGMPFTGIHPLRSERLGGSGGGGGDMDYAAGQSSGSTIGQWRLQHPNQHFSIAFGHADGMTGMESTPAPTAGLFPLDAEAMDQQQYLASGQLGAKPTVSNLSSIKLEENQNLPRQFLGLQHGSDQYSSANNAWTDLYLSGFNSSTSPLM